MILAALFLGTVLAANFDTWGYGTEAGDKNRGFLGKGCLKSGTWKQMTISSGFSSSLTGLAADVESCAQSCWQKRNPKLCATFSMKGSTCYISSVYDWSPSDWGCQEDIYVLFPSDWTIGEATAGEMNCMELPGDGTGGTEKNIGTASSLQACAKKVVADEPTANGATWSKNKNTCFAEFGMNSVCRQCSAKYSTCYVNVAIGRGERGNAGLKDNCNVDMDCQAGLECRRKRWGKICEKQRNTQAQSMTAAVEETQTTSMAVKGFAAIGLTVILYGSYKHYFQKN